MKIRNLLATLFLSIAVGAQQGNPTSVYCDYHNQYANRAGTEYPNGKCYAVYKHLYWQNGKSYEHKLTMKCQ